MITMIVTDALAQAGGAQEPANPMAAILSQLGFLLPMFIIMYVLLIRPQQLQKKRAESMLKALKKGDRVLTNGGMYGTVVGLDDSRVTLKVADDTRIEFVKSAVVQVLEESK
jgi:preprotein translocase subunit YajC